MSLPRAQVYVNWGRVVAECGRPECTDARKVEFGQTGMQCAAGHPSALDWPDNLPAILTVLGERLSDKRRNWFPAGHPQAVATGQPHGQSLDDLRAETAGGEEADAQAVTDQRADLIARLRALGSDDDIIRDIREAL